MKKLNYLFTAVVLLGVLFTVGCGGDDSPGLTPEQVILEKFAATWNLSSVTYNNGSEYATDFANFTLTITGAKGYSTSGSPAFGPFSQNSSSGAWDFVTPPTDAAASAFKVTRASDGLVMDVQLSDTQMTLSFNFIDADGNGAHDGRVEAVTGDWVFNFTK